MRNKKTSKFTLSPFCIVRSDPCFTIKRLAFNVKTQTRVQLNETGYIILRILENNSLTVDNLKYLLSKETDPSYSVAIADFIANMLRDGFIINSDKVIGAISNYQPKEFRDINIPITSTPYEVEIHLTLACNMRCIHCAYDAGEPLTNELKLEDWQKVIAELEKLRVLRLIISGGEPFVFRNIRKLLNCMVSKRIRIDILTNGSLIDKDIARRLNSPNLSITVSLDGATKQTHENFRRVECFDKIINGIQVLAENNVVFHLSAVLHKKTLKKSKQWLN